MKKSILAIIAAGALVVGFAGQSMAAYTTAGELIWSVYADPTVTLLQTDANGNVLKNPNGTDKTYSASGEVGTDAGMVNSTTSAGYGSNQNLGSVTLSQLGLTNYIKNANTGAIDLSGAHISYFGLNITNSSTGTGQYWVMGNTTTAPRINASQGTQILNLANTPAYYDGSGASALDTASYYGTFEKNGTSKGSYGGVLRASAGWNASIDLNSLLTGDHYVDMGLYYINYTGALTPTTSPMVATIRTSLAAGADNVFGTADDIITSTLNPSAVPVPPSALLLAPGLLGLLALRKRNTAV